MAAMQRRIGPTVVGVYGILQPFSDAIKLLIKEVLFPQHTNSILFLLSPIFTFCLAISL
jgi:NADH:ubiquinone oxidoreductase subunit H